MKLTLLSAAALLACADAFVVNVSVEDASAWERMDVPAVWRTAPFLAFLRHCTCIFLNFLLAPFTTAPCRNTGLFFTEHGVGRQGLSDCPVYSVR